MILNYFESFSLLLVMKKLFLLLVVPFLFASCEGLMSSLQGEEEQGNENTALEFDAVSDYVDGATSYLFSNGYVITCSQDEKYGTDGYMIFADSLDVTNKVWVEENAMAMLCDENYKPVIMMDDEYSYHLTETSEGIYDVIINDLDGNQLTEITVVSVGSIDESEVESRADQTPKWWIDKSFLIYQSVQELFSKEPTKLSRASTIAGLISNFLPDSPLNTFSNISMTLGEALKGTAGGYIGLMLLTYDGIIKARDFSVEKLIGECSANIVSAVQTGFGEYNLLINFSGIGQGAAFYRVQYWDESGGIVDNRYSTDIMLASNGYQELKIDFSGAEQTKGFQVIMFPDVFYGHPYLQKFYCVRSDIFYLTLKPLEIVSFERSGAYYYDNTVEVDFNYSLNVQADLQETEDYGLFLDDGGEISYLSLKDDMSLSGECYVTFPEDLYNCNYSNFTAEYTGNVQVGTYTVIDGETEYYVSSVSRPELLYDRRPEMNMYDMVSQYIDLDEPHIDDNGEERDRYVSYEYKVMFSGCLFFEDILTIWLPGIWTNPGEEPSAVGRLQDEYEYSGSDNYYHSSDLDDELAPIYFDAVLGDGSRFELPQCIVCTNTGSYISPGRLIVTSTLSRALKIPYVEDVEFIVSPDTESTHIRPKFGKK